MRRTATLSAFVWLAACGGQPDAAGSHTEIELATARTAAQAAADALQARLKGELTGAMQSGGPLAAIEVCAIRADAIAAEISAETGLDVGRTALRVRNPKNASDDWEGEQLAAFLTAIANGEDAATRQAGKVVSREDGDVYRWMRPIVLEPACAVCHGDAIGPDLALAIGEVYPLDEATGFRPGELRGAFTVTAPLHRDQPQ